jgi:drug/metabolite transporter (DMT)-like permease
LLDASVRTNASKVAESYVADIRARLDLAARWSLYISATMATIWIVIAAWANPLNTPDAPNRKRPPWWLCLALSFLLAAATGWILSSPYDNLLTDKLGLISPDVSPEIGALSAVTAVIAYYIATLLATPYIVRPAVPLASALTQHVLLP